MAAKHNSRVGTLFMMVLFLAAIAGGGYVYRDLLRGTRVGNWLGLKDTVPAKDVYYCPMHPDYKANKPGDCPICNMALVKVEPEPQGGSASAEKSAKKEQAAKDVYYCPMHPDYQSSRAGTCPICNMDLVKREPDAHEHGAVAGTPGAARMVFISPEKQQLIGVQVSTVGEEPLTRTIITVGQLTYDETRLVRIQPRVEGWIEQVFVDFTGKWVKKGQPLLSVYSPELLSTQRELLDCQTRQGLSGHQRLSGNRRQRSIPL